MGYIIVSLLATICIVHVTYGTECSPGPGYRFPITCPRMLNSTKSYCCEIDGSFRCCDAEEFASLRRHDDDAQLPVLRHKRQFSYSYGSDSQIIKSESSGLGPAVTAVIYLAWIIPLVLMCCCCYCCACCPCYHWCHRNTTNVTVVQPAGVGGGNVQNNFCVSVPTQPVTQQPCAMTSMQQAPPPYNPGYGQQFGGVGQI